MKAEYSVEGPKALRLAAEDLADACSDLCCRVGIRTSLRAAYRSTLGEGVKPEERELLRRLG
ncbi:MAG TPA: hypothetical protein VGB70_12685 [Allosphingosinicella sp.]